MVPEKFGYFSEYREVTGTPQGVYGPYWALVEKEGSKQGVGRAPHRPKRNCFRVWGAGPFFPSPLLLFPPSPSRNRKGGANLLGVGLPPPLGAPPPLDRKSVV